MVVILSTCLIFPNLLLCLSSNDQTKLISLAEDLLNLAKVPQKQTLLTRDALWQLPLLCLMGLFMVLEASVRNRGRVLWKVALKVWRIESLRS